jgi:hypothetical protein
VLQQTPSTHCPLVHWLALLQTVPLVSFDTHDEPLQ